MVIDQLQPEEIWVVSKPKTETKIDVPMDFLAPTRDAG